MTEAAAVVVGMIARSMEVAPLFSWLVAQFPEETREGLINTLNSIQGEVVVIWMNPEDEPEAGPRITLTPEGAERFGWRLDDESRAWIPAHLPHARLRLRSRKRMLSLTDFAGGRAGGSEQCDPTLGSLASIVDPNAIDPARIFDELAEANANESEAIPVRRRGRPPVDSEPRLPAIVMLGCRPWPPTVFEGATWKCQVCRDRPLTPSMECGWCNRGGQDGLIPASIRAQARLSRTPTVRRVATAGARRLKGGTEH
jgi:hypothetical protein